MRRFAFLCVLLASCFSFSQLPQPENCPPVAQEIHQTQEQPQASEQPPSIRIKSLSFTSDQPLPAINKEVASEVEGKTIDFSEGWPLELAAVVRDAWQHYGYYRVQVDDPDLDILQETQQEEVARVTVKIDPGKQYWTKDISFSNNLQFHSSQLRDLFPVPDGEIFDTRKMAEGMVALRKLYGERGFIDFAAVPSTQIDESRKRISLMLDLDEGKQFRVGKFEILGMDPVLAQGLIADSGLEPGSIFNARLLEVFFQRNKSLLPARTNAEDTTQRHIDEQAGTIDLTIDVRSCPATND